MRRIVIGALAALCLSGCTPYTGINSLSLPGTVGTGSDSYQIKVQLANANDLVANTPVFVNDINVGTVT
jgi:phospholipid/cholesterol/gamma-HCH transport system substrate-binding protein